MTVVRFTVEPSSIGHDVTSYTLRCPHWTVEQLTSPHEGPFAFGRRLAELREVWERDGCRLCDAALALSALDRASTAAEEQEAVARKEAEPCPTC